MHLGMQIESMLKDSDTGCQVTEIFESGQIFVHKEVKVGMVLSSIQDKRFSIYDPFSTISKNLLRAIEECSEKNDLQVYSSVCGLVSQI